MSVEAFSVDQSSVSLDYLQQKTLWEPVSFSGKGIFTGEFSAIVIYPASAGHGIVFERIDRPHAPPIKATLNAVKATPRCTILGNEQVQVQTVEHLLSALNALGIDNALITVDGPEIPMGDGSALPFIEKIKQAGIQELKERSRVRVLSAPLFFSEGDAHIIALPANEFRISYTLHYPQSPLIRTQFYTIAVDEDSYEQQLAPSRTFCLYEEIAPLVERGLIKGGGVGQCGHYSRRSRPKSRRASI